MEEFPRRFGPFVLLKPLARGGMGALYLAMHGDRMTQKVCVIKTVLPHLADKEYLHRFRDEAKVVVRLSHGNLVPVFDFGQVSGEIYLAMDYVEGKDLRAIWNRCAQKGIAFPVDVAVHVVKELARGLGYAHSFGELKLVHRDVSPPNVLLSWSGEVKLTDFGLATSTLKLEKTAPGVIYGKLSYMSPEQARGEPLDGRTDLFAAGIILWELLTGRQLFPPMSRPSPVREEPPAQDDLLKRVRHPEIVPPSKRSSRVPPELDAIVMKSLAPMLWERYQNCEELRADLAGFLAKTAPATDADRISKFLRELYGEDIEKERAERDRLATSATGMLSEAIPTPPPRMPLERMGGSSLASTAKDAPHARAADGQHPGQPRDLKVLPVPPQSNAPISNAASGGSIDPLNVIGRVIGGRYRLRRLVGEGGMGRVYEAEHIEIGKRVALKILHPAYSKTPELVERLRREARAASKIQHPNVVDVTDSGTTGDGAFFFVMEFLEGMELGTVVFREGRLAVPRALHIATQMCRALKAAHEAGVIHRDLKPENVLVMIRDGQRDFVKIFDFGIAKSMGEGDLDVHSPTHRPERRLTRPGMAMGTPEYMAPEQAAGHPADPRSDIYAVGGIVYEMLSGRPPFQGANFMEVLHKKATEMPEPLSRLRQDIPPELDALVNRVMARDPVERPQTMEALEIELQKVLALFTPPPTPMPVVASSASVPPAPSSEAALTSSEATETTALSVRATLPWHQRAITALSQLEWVSWLTRRRGFAATASAGAALVLVIVLWALLGRGVGTDGQGVPGTGNNTLAAGGGDALSFDAAALSTPADAAHATAAVPVEAGAQVAAVDGGTGPQATGTPGAEETVPTGHGSKVGRNRGGDAAARPTESGAAAAKKHLARAEQLVAAQRFREAREAYEDVRKAGDRRGSALGLAEVAFQEKNYPEAVKLARKAAELGGGVRARVLMGDAYFRLAKFTEAARSYSDALRLDPRNKSAQSGLTLANKRLN